MSPAGRDWAKPPNTLSVQAAWFDYDNDGLLDLVVIELHSVDSRDRPALHQRDVESTATQRPIPPCLIGFTTIWAAASLRT